MGGLYSSIARVTLATGAADCFGIQKRKAGCSMEPVWYIQTEGGEIEGPLAGAMLKGRADAGIVKPDTPVRKGAEGKWTVASNVKGLFASSPPLPDKHETSVWHSAPQPLDSRVPPVAPPMTSVSLPDTQGNSLRRFIPMYGWIFSGVLSGGLVGLLLLNHFLPTPSTAPGPKADAENVQLRERLRQAEAAKAEAETALAAVRAKEEAAAKEKAEAELAAIKAKEEAAAKARAEAAKAEAAIREKEKEEAAALAKGRAARAAMKAEAEAKEKRLQETPIVVTDAKTLLEIHENPSKYVNRTITIHNSPSRRLFVETFLHREAEMRAYILCIEFGGQTFGNNLSLIPDVLNYSCPTDIGLKLREMSAREPTLSAVGLNYMTFHIGKINKSSSTYYIAEFQDWEFSIITVR